MHYRKAKGPIRICELCGIEFQARQYNQVYCKKTCYTKGKFGKVYQRKWRKIRSSSNPKQFLSELLSLRNRRQFLTTEDLLDIWNKQKGLCALSGFPMTYIFGEGRQHTNISIDRIDNTKSYEKDNIRLVCTIVNTMRNTLDDSELITWCRRIVNNSNKEIN